jgi:hypothetical protein
MNFTTEILPYIQIGTTLIGGWFLYQKLQHKDSQIDTLTKNFDEVSKMLNLYKAEDFQKYMDMKLETKDMEHNKDKADLEKLANFKFSEDNPEFIKAFEHIRFEWSTKQAELLNIVGYFILQADIKQREEILSKIPLSRSLIEDVLEKYEKNRK